MQSNIQDLTLIGEVFNLDVWASPLEVKMKRIKLTQSKFALVDDEDFEWLNQWGWYAQESHGNFYAVRGIYNAEHKQRQLRMHRFILNAPMGSIIDHHNGDGLDNQRHNLRICTNQENTWNGKVKSTNRYGYKGIALRSDPRYILKNPWRASIRKGDKIYNLGHYSTGEEAARAYNKKAKELYGEYAHINIIDNEINENLKILAQSSRLSCAKRYARLDRKLSKFRGVYWIKSNQKWLARITINKHPYKLGYYKDEKEAAYIYNQFAEQLFGEFAYLNIIPPEENTDEQ